MTECRVFYNGGKITGFEVEGHSEYAAIGKDIVCASVSSVVQGAVLGVGKVAFVPYYFTAAKGYLEFFLKTKDIIIEHDSEIKAQAILETMAMTVEDIAISFPSNVSLKKVEV